jgi:hypothetical protein
MIERGRLRIDAGITGKIDDRHQRAAQTDHPFDRRRHFRCRGDRRRAHHLAHLEDIDAEGFTPSPVRASVPSENSRISSLLVPASLVRASMFFSRSDISLFPRSETRRSASTRHLNPNKHRCVRSARLRRNSAARSDLGPVTNPETAPVAALDVDRCRNVVHQFTGIAPVGLQQKRLLVCVPQRLPTGSSKTRLVRLFTKSTFSSPVSGCENLRLWVGT